MTAAMCSQNSNALRVTSVNKEKKRTSLTRKVTHVKHIHCARAFYPVSNNTLFSSRCLIPSLCWTYQQCSTRLKVTLQCSSSAAHLPRSLSSLCRAQCFEGGRLRHKHAATHAADAPAPLLSCTDSANFLPTSSLPPPPLSSPQLLPLPC